MFVSKLRMQFRNPVLHQFSRRRYLHNASVIPHIDKCHSTMAPLRRNPSTHPNPNPYVLLTQLPALMSPADELQLLAIKTESSSAISPRLRNRNVLSCAQNGERVGFRKQSRGGCVQHSLPFWPCWTSNLRTAPRFLHARASQERQGVRPW